MDVRPDEEAGLARVVGRFLRITLLALALVLVIGAALEGALRAAGFEPQNLNRVGLSGTVEDHWTQWANRPNIRTDEFAVTNDFGIHEDRQITLKKPPGIRRVAVVGSSVVWGIGQPLENTIPRAAERALRSRACEAEVLNFGTYSFNMVHASAYIQSKVHQFEPDAIVVVMDMQMVFPQFPNPVPASAQAATVQRLGFFEGLVKRATEYSVVLTWLDDGAATRKELAKRLPFAPETRQAPKARSATPADSGPGVLQRAWEGIEAWPTELLARLKAVKRNEAVAVTPARPAVAAPATDATIADYESRRKRELGALVAAVSGFAQGMGFKMYFVTPYVPYFVSTPQEFAGFGMGILGDSPRRYGSGPAAARREVELASAVIATQAAREGAGVIDMLPLSRQRGFASGDFAADGIHLSPAGYRRVGDLIAERLVKDGLCGPPAKPGT